MLAEPAGRAFGVVGLAFFCGTSFVGLASFCGTSSGLPPADALEDDVVEELGVVGAAGAGMLGMLGPASKDDVAPTYPMHTGAVAIGPWYQVKPT